MKTHMPAKFYLMIIQNLIVIVLLLNLKLKNKTYIKKLKIIFENQRFEIILKTTIATDEFDRIETRFINFKNVTVLNHKNEWKYGGKNNFYNKYNLKVQSEDFILPTFQILMYKDNKIYEIITLKPESIKLAKVAKDNEKFSNVIAQNLEVVTHKTKQYTNNKLLTILELRTTQGNVEDFNLKNFDDQGVTSINIEESLKKINELEVVNPFLIRRRDLLNHFLKK